MKILNLSNSINDSSNTINSIAAISQKNTSATEEVTATIQNQ